MRKAEIIKTKGRHVPEKKKMQTASQSRVQALPILAFMHVVDIHMLKIEALRFPEFDNKRSEGELSITPFDKVETAYREDKRGVIAIVSVGIEASIENKKVFTISALYRAIYKIDDAYDGDLTEERATAFCRSTSLAHVWPYWRETLASTCVRMNLPPVLAPLLIVGTDTEPETEEVDHT